MNGQRTMKDALFVLALCLLAAGGGYWVRAWEDYRAAQQAIFDAPSDGTLTIPSEIDLVAGESPREVHAETRGKRVIWQSLDAELSVAPYTAKSVWVWSAKPGEFRLQAWSAVDAVPTQPSICIVKVKEKGKP